MTEAEKIRIAQEAIMAYYSTDDPENRAYALEINAQVSPEAICIHQKSIVIDTCSFYLESYNWHLKESGVAALNLTVPSVHDGLEGAVNAIIHHYAAIAETPDHFVLAETADDIRQAKKDGKIAIIIGAQSPRFIEHASLASAVEVFAKMGMRILQIGYNQRTFATEGCLCNEGGGLSATGRQLIAAMEDSGITVDISHIAHRAAMEAMEDRKSVV